MSDDYIEVTDAEVPFQTTKTYKMDDLSTVQSSILPVCQNIVGEIKKASVAETKDGAMAFIKLELTLPDGIPTQNDEGETEYRYRNKTVFPGMLETIFWIDKTKKTSNWFKERQHLVGIKSFAAALGIVDIEKQMAEKPNELLISLIGRRLLFSIKHEANTFPNEQGERVPDGTFRERVYGWKKAVEE